MRIGEGVLLSARRKKRHGERVVRPDSIAHRPESRIPTTGLGCVAIQENPAQWSLRRPEVAFSFGNGSDTKGSGYVAFLLDPRKAILQVGT